MTTPNPEERATIERWRDNAAKATAWAESAESERTQRRPSSDAIAGTEALVSIALSLSVIAEVVSLTLAEDR